MFDYVRCEHELPDGLEASGIVFQTKSLDRDLTAFRITSDGLLIESYEPPLGTEVSRVVRQKGIINFYSNVLVDQSPVDTASEEARSRRFRWCEYNAHFEDGKLTKIAAVLEGQQTDSHP